MVSSDLESERSNKEQTVPETASEVLRDKQSVPAPPKRTAALSRQKRGKIPKSRHTVASTVGMKSC